ncbi:MAG: hypothetical protein AAF441_26495 [Pseudomonadota bacterium]
MSWIRVVLFTFALFLTSAAGFAEEPEAGHLRLIDRLDRPDDGYCLDVLGVGELMRLEVPIFAHNCKPALTPDSAVDLTPEGRIRFTALNLCITAAGVNGRALPGASIILRPCGHKAPFFESPALQAFKIAADGKVQLEGSDLCLAAGEQSATTYSTQDRWRVLTVETCSEVPAELARWEFVSRPRPGG